MSRGQSRNMRTAIGLVEVVSVGNSLFVCIEDASLLCKAFLAGVMSSLP
jgi:hypothetical protein